MMRGKAIRLFELLVIAAVVLGMHRLVRADALGTIEGSVTTKAGTAITGASVTLNGCTSRTVTTDGSGHWTAANLPACKYNITATATGFMVAGGTVTLTAGGSASLALSLVQVARKDPPKIEKKPEP